MLVDMGSLTHLYKSLKPQILGELLVINNLTTSYALESWTATNQWKSFYEIAKTAESDFVTNIQYFEGFAVEKNVIISSISGRDIAKKIKTICEKYFNPDIKANRIKLRRISSEHIRTSFFGRRIFERDGVDLDNFYLDNTTPVPSINLIDVLDEDAENKLNRQLRNLIHPSSVPLLTNEFIHFFSKEGLSPKNSNF